MELLGFHNLLEWLTELRKTVYLPDYQFIVKGYNLGTTRYKRCIGPGIGEGVQSFHAFSESTILPASLCVHQRKSSSNPFVRIFTETLIHKHVWLNHWTLAIELNFQPLSLSQEVSRWGWKFQPSNHLVDSPGNHLSIPWVSPGAPSH